MRLTHALAFVVALSVAFDLNALTYQFYDRVAPPYRSALAVFTADIIEFLANTTIPDNSSEARLIAQVLESKVRLFSNHLGQASAASDAIRQQLDTRVLQLITDSLRIESLIQQNQQRSDRVQGQIDEARYQVRRGTDLVIHAERQEREDAARLSDAEDCGCIPSFWRIWRRFPRIACGIGARDEARNRAISSIQHLKVTRNRLDQLQSQLVSLQQEHVALRRGKSGLESDRTRLRDEHNLTRGERDRIVGFNTALNSLITHINAVFGKSKDFTDVVTRLINMELVIGPLEALGDQIVGYSGDEPSEGEIKRKIHENLKLIKEKLPLTL